MLNPTSQCAVYVVDDDPTVLRMLHSLIKTIGVSVRPFPSADEFLRTYEQTPCECLLCDIRMPGMDGLEVQRRLAERGAALPIIFLTGHAEVGSAVQAMKGGAFDFLEKPFGAQALLGRIQSALEYSRVQHAERLAESATAARIALLTPKERSIVRHVVDGRSSREISELLGISVRTVENHRARVLEKLHVASTVELVKMFR